MRFCIRVHVYYTILFAKSTVYKLTILTQIIYSIFKIQKIYTYNMTRLGNEENESFEISTIELLPKFL